MKWLGGGYCLVSRFSVNTAWANGHKATQQLASFPQYYSFPAEDVRHADKVHAHYKMNSFNKCICTAAEIVTIHELRRKYLVETFNTSINTTNAGLITPGGNQQEEENRNISTYPPVRPTSRGGPWMVRTGAQSCCFRRSVCIARL